MSCRADRGTALDALGPHGRREVQGTITSDSDDPELKELSQQIVRIGGQVLVRFSSIPGLTAVVPAAQVRQLSQRKDVVHISPSRDTWPATARSSAPPAR